MLSKRLRFQKNRPSRHRVAQSDLLISEALEKRQMLSANSDNVFYDIELLDEHHQPVTWQQPSWLTPNSYSAPWTIGEGQNGAGIQSQWTSDNNLTDSNGFLDLKENIIYTIEGFKDALSKGHVREVSDDLIGVFGQNYTAHDGTTSPTTMYPAQLRRAWAFSSDTLYTLLVLNQRFPGDTVISPDGSTEYRISSKTNQAIERIVGFGFTGNWIEPPGQYSPASEPGNPKPFPNTFQLNISVFSKQGTFITTNPLETNVPADGLSINVPTVRRFFDFTNKVENGRPVDIMPLPEEVFAKLEAYYQSGVQNAKTPVEIFSEISGITDISYLLMYPNTVKTINGVPAGNASQQVYDADNVDLLSQDQQITTTLNYLPWQEACQEIGGYYQNTPVQNTQTQVEKFFTKFAKTKLDAIEQAGGLNPTEVEKNVEELAIGLRALMALAYDASPFWSSYGIGYSNAANPMVGKKLSEIDSENSFIDWFNGQEIQMDNIWIPGGITYPGTTTSPPAYTIPVIPLPVPTPDRTLPTFDNYTYDGWFELDTPATFVSAATASAFPTPSDNNFTTNLEITTSGTALVFDYKSTSSDTVSAQNISQLMDMLQPSTTIEVEGSQKELQDIYKTVGNSLPDEFATYIALAGGVDRVTGSPFADVIIGPSHEAPHGRLTVNAGAGDDIIAPGRGGSLVQLGPGADTVVFSRGDLFGTVNFIDFQANNGDKLALGFGIEATIDESDPTTIVLNDLFSSAQKTLRLTPLLPGSDGKWSDAGWAEFAIQSIAVSPQPGELNYIETHTFIDPALTDLSKYKLEVSTPINSYSMARNQLRAGDKVSVALGGTSKIYTADVFNHHAPQKVGFVIDFETDGLSQLPSILDPTISITPLRQPVDVDFEILTGQVTAGIPNLQAQKGTTVTFTVQNIDHTPGYPSTPNVIPYMEVPGSSMYLFNNPAGTKDLGHILGKVTQINVNEATGAGTVTLFVNPNLDPAATLNTNDYLGWKSADVPSYGGQQIEVFVSRRNGNLDTYDSIFSAPHSHHIKASEINTLVAAAGQDYNFATALTPPNIPFSAWKPIGGNQIAFMGGLANYLHTNNLDYYPSLPSDYYYAPVEISIDDELPIDSGPGKINLSSSFSVFELQTYTPIQLQNICNQLNTVSEDANGYNDLPAGMPAGAQFKGTRALVTGSQVVIKGSGRINNWNIYSDPYYKFGAHNQTQGGSAHDDVASNIYYTIGSDILTVSSTHTPEQADTFKDAIIASSFTSAWPVIKGIGGVRLQDFDSIDIIGTSGATLETPHFLRHQHPKLQFRESSVSLSNHKQLGGWNWQADGPQIAGWGSYAQGNFIQANDDSFKIGAPNTHFWENTVVQGKAGVALGTSYGYLNGGFAGSRVDGLYAHRIVTDDADVALATAWASPVPEYFYEQTTATNGVATTVPQTLLVKDVFVPKLQLEVVQPAKDVHNKGAVNKWDLNQISSGATVDFRRSLRGFPFSTTSSAPFQVDLGLIDMRQNWEINTEVPTPNYVQLQNNNNWPNTKVISAPPYSSFRNYQKVENSWAMAGAGGTVTVTQGNQNINLFSSHNDTHIKRPQLKRATKIRINRNSDVIGPQPVRMMYSQIKAAVSSNLGVSDDDNYVITALASGKVEKKQGDSWVDVSTPPRSSNPFELLALLQRRIIKPTDEIRWVPNTEDQGEVSTKAFELIGWNGSSTSEEKTSVEIDASGWSDL